jgi:hypothetical protein
MMITRKDRVEPKNVLGPSRNSLLASSIEESYNKT